MCASWMNDTAAMTADILDDLFSACALAAFLEQAARQQD